MQDISRRDIEITVVILVVLVASVIGWFAFRHHKTTAHVALTGVYTGWSTDNASLRGIQFNYPPTWTDINSHSKCTGAILATLTPPVREINAAGTGPQYFLEIEKYGTENAHCQQDGTSVRSRSFDSVSSSDRLQSGLFKKDWLTFFRGGNNTYTETQVDTALITPDEYNGSQTTLVGSDTLTYEGSSYQISIETSTTENQTEIPNTIDINSFRTTQLYKDTLNILNSIQKN